MSGTACPECEATVAVMADTRQNEIVECGECRTELEVIETSPLTLQLAPEVEEDWGE
jgi:alpha-aminoadipate carrier protein LysW